MTKEQEVNSAGWNLDNSYGRLPELFYSRLDSTPVDEPELIVLNESLAEELGLDVEYLKSEEGVRIFAGNKTPKGSDPLAQAYAGHQFGHFTMLGDGRAILLGEQITPEGERFDIQLKGSGRTPYSRGGDGRAALGPMLREHIMSEAMHALGIPTNRSLAVVITGEPVYRETELPGAILTRVAASHLRVGTFQFAAGGGEKEDLKALADYTLNRHFANVDIVEEENRYLSLLNEVIKRQAQLIAKWQLVGFIHGVMNTDNMTISGETIDYGPCAFMDTYDPATVFSSIDRQGRYAYGNQPKIGVWNLARLAETLLPLIHDDQEKAVEIAEETLSKFSQLYRKEWLEGMRAKLGIFNEEQEDEALIEDLLQLMEKNKADYTNTFRALTLNKLEGMELFKTKEFNEWYEKWQGRRKRQEESDESSNDLMKNSNPAVIPRNHRVEEALEAAEKQGDYSVMERLLDVLSDPFNYSAVQEEYCIPQDPSAGPYRTFCGT
ncbi:YdiU family protein [Evansella sp. AB-P1]|uniref:protein adenylyltransferase SelO n=1 Tax=Evansella sp. AB-P1 TaxID=3037653 RepID=UPI00241D9D5D|nr:YdiU family protein [Evansella sp. AB-P1]MDG5787069.1 YdiU family protein [Evansella sp. AB-P1]